MLYLLDLDFECYEMIEGQRLTKGINMLCCITEKVLIEKYSKELLSHDADNSIQANIHHAYHQKFLTVTGRKHVCYECDNAVVELSNTSRCMKCMGRRLAFNETYGEEQHERACDLQCKLDRLVREFEELNEEAVSFNRLNGEQAVLVSQLQEAVRELRGVSNDTV